MLPIGNTPMKHKIKRFKLKRALNLLELSLYGVGVILGAGIYALIGVGAGIAGNAVWISFIIAAIVAGFTGLSYAELASMYPKEAAEYTYTKKAFNKRQFSFIIGWLMIIAGIVSAVAVAFGFAGYFTHLWGGSVTVVAFILLLVLSFISYLGIKESSTFNIVATIIETSGLLIVIAIGAYVFFSKGIQVNLLETPLGIGVPGIMSAVAIIFFAFLGFEDMVNLAEETKNPKKTVPRALVLALGLSTLLYLLVSFSAVNTVGWEKLSSSSAPLTLTVSSVIPKADLLFSLIALFATANTALILLVVSSRILFGMARDHSFPAILSKIGSRGTPTAAVIISGAIALGLSLTSTIKTVAQVTDLSLFIIYAAVNLSLIVLRFKVPKAARGFKVPFNIGKFPVLPALGLATSLGMIFYFEKNVLLIGLAIIGSGILVYRIFSPNPQSA